MSNSDDPDYTNIDERVRKCILHIAFILIRTIISDSSYSDARWQLFAIPYNGMGVMTLETILCFWCQTLKLPNNAALRYRLFSINCDKTFRCGYIYIATGINFLSAN